VEGSKGSKGSRVTEEIARDRFSVRAHRENLAPRLREPREVPERVRHAQGRQAALARAEEIARASRLEVFFRDEEAVGRLLEHGEAAAGFRRRGLADHEGAPGSAMAAADAAPELMELGEAERLGVLDDHERRLRDVDADFHHRRRHEDRHASRGEVREDGLALGRRHAPVEDADANRGEDGGNAIGRLARRGDRAWPFLDRRHDDVDALVRGRALPRECVDPVAGLLLANPGRDLGPSRRLLVEDRYVQLAVHGPGQRARDGRGGHDEDVGRGAALAEEPSPVRHAEAVLLVDDDETEAAETHRGLDESVRSDERVDLSGGEGREQPLAPRSSNPPGQEAQAHARARQPRREALGVLLGQDLGGRHERGLGAVLRGDQHREACDHRLARSHVALEQARHRSARAQIVGDLAHRALLSVRQRKRKDVTRELLDRLLRRQHPAGAIPQPRSAILDAGGEGQQLLARELRQCRLG